MILQFRLPVLFCCLLGLSAHHACAQNTQLMPRLEKTNGITRLYVSGNPFLILGGELGNSTTSDFDYMRPVWPKLKSMHLNTVLAPVYWELL